MYYESYLEISRSLEITFQKTRNFIWIISLLDFSQMHLMDLVAYNDHSIDIIVSH